MKEILMEIELLFFKMTEVNKEYEQSVGNEELPFGKVLYALTRDKKFFNMDNNELIKYIQKIQLIEG